MDTACWRSLPCCLWFMFLLLLLLMLLLMLPTPLLLHRPSGVRGVRCGD